MNRKMSYQNVGATGFGSGLPAIWAMEAEADSRNFKIALLATIMIHILLLWVVLPGAGHPIDQGRKLKKKPIVRILLKAPDDPLPDIIIKPPVHPVPVPDQTPEAPEPMVSVNAVSEPGLPVDGFYVDDEFPDNVDPLTLHTVGLVAPVYDMAQLQGNIKYPRLGQLAGMEGYVIVQAVLNRDGTISDVKVMGGTLNGLGFPEAAVSAVRKLSFSPGFYHGTPVSVVMNLTIHFRLRR